MRLSLVAQAAATLALLAAPVAARSREVPAATPIGQPVDCVQLTQVRDTKVRDDRTIDFYLRTGEVYRNTLPLRCPDLGFQEAFSYKSYTQRLCSVDTITVLRPSSAIPLGTTCGLGKFQPVTIAGDKPARSRR